MVRGNAYKFSDFWPQKEKVRMVRAAYLRRLEQSGEIKPGIPDTTKAGEAKSLGVLGK